MVIDAIVEGFIRVSVGSVCAVFNYTWPWGSVVYHTISAPVVAACYALSTHVGLVNPTVLPDLGPEYGVVPPPIRRQPLVHVDGIALAHAVMAPGARELERFRDEQPGTTSNYLYFAAGVALQVPLAPFDTKLGKSIDQIKADNDRLGKLMHPRLEAERDALRSFRRLLRKQPAAGVLEKSEAYPVGRRTYSAASWLGSVWQTVLTTLRRALQRSVRSHLLRRVDDLDQILQNGLSERKEWIHSLAPSSLSKVEEMVGPVCQASRDLTDAKWQLEAKVDELHVAALGSGGSFELAGGTAGIQAELTSGLSGIRTAQSSFTNMCMFAWADRNAATDVISRLAHDIEVYMYAQESLKELRDRIQADPLNEPSKMMAFEVEMDNTAVWGLRCIEYWEEERES
ncbi:hypothetical protein UCRPA7_8311 [Phaeoacremonium minimum UCRPA7]|uniref:Uncharacterized protein n=1 Tax=Phaeoacremonium minimum (strain UCR-PA7) TaxID=1286976 RepID=R8BA70_PHAM7|nr:hypothetical protein UCRPA7_8311 [Phaeoacremonium minimum UCRPA7]EON96215.1 hypothetical protein UCRPA7_8311 [Phaeoacremonium minimum UCRPA7]